MAGFPHDRLATKPSDFIIKKVGSLDFGNDGCPWMRGKQVAGKNDHQLISPDYVASFIHRSQPISIAIVGQSNFRPAFSDCRHQIFQRFGERWVRMVMRKMTIHLSIEFNDLCPQFFK